MWLTRRREEAAGPLRPPPGGRQPAAPTAEARLRSRDGELLAFEPDRWRARASDDERRILAGVTGPVLDVGCGPGRLVHHLLSSGIPAMGVDPAPGAVADAQGRGAPALQRSVWERLPGEGRWGTVLLFDGNIGIGGDPVALLRRCRELGSAAGRVVLETEAPGTASRRLDVRVERGGDVTRWFPWATVGADDLGPVAARAGLEVRWLRRTEGPGSSRRWFACLGGVTDGGRSDGGG